MKWIIRLGAVLIGIVVLVGVIGYISINKIAKAGVEHGGTYALGVDTKLKDINVGVLSGSLSMNGLSIANPEGFKADHFLSLGDGNVQVSLGSLMSDQVDVPVLKLSDIQIDLEKDKGKANYDVILEHLAKVTGGEEPSQPAEKTGGKKFVVHELLIKNVKVNAQVIGGISVPVVIPEIKLTDVGSDGEGVTLGDLSGIIVTSILATTVETAGDILPGGIGEGLQGGLKAVGDLGNFGVQVIGDVTTAAGEVVGKAAEVVGEGAKQAGEAVKAVGDTANQTVGEAGKAVGDVGKEAGKAVESIGEGLGGLLGGKKKDEKPADEKKQ